MIITPDMLPCESVHTADEALSDINTDKKSIFYLHICFIPTYTTWYISSLFMTDYLV